MVKSPPTKYHARKIAVLLPSLEGGGAERSMLNLVNAFLKRGREVDLLLCRAKGAYMDLVPEAANMVTLKASGPLLTRVLAALANRDGLSSIIKPVIFAKKIAPEIARLNDLRHYLDERQPDVVLSALTYANLLAIWATRTARLKVPVVVSERIALSTHCRTASNYRKWRWRYLPPAVRKNYPSADAVVAVSKHVADDLSENVGLSAQSITTIYNPVVDDDLRSQARQPIEHEWFTKGAPPVILGVGRLTQQKDFATLVRAFAKVRARRPARLLILGEGKLRAELERLATSMGVAADVRLPGFVANPFQYMANASVLVLSSEYEGLPGVLIQAIACGCPVVSTDCPGGSAEILADGKYGPLVPVGDEAAMARAIEAVLDNPPGRKELNGRAAEFSVERAADHYLELLDMVVTKQVTRVQAET